MDTPSLVITVQDASTLNQTCGQAFLAALKSRPPVSDVKPRLAPIFAPAAPRTAPLSVTAPLDARPSELLTEACGAAAVKRRRPAVDEDWDEPAQPQQDDDSSGPEGADGTKPCKCGPPACGINSALPRSPGAKLPCSRATSVMWQRPHVCYDGHGCRSAQSLRGPHAMSTSFPMHASHA